jgi:hypothetical protein
MTVNMTAIPRFNPNELDAYDALTGGEGGTEPGTAPETEATTTYLTPDALLVYCQAQLGNIDGQINNIMQSAQNANYDQQDLTSVQAALSQYADGCNASQAQSLVDTLNKALTTIEGRDPGSPAVGAIQSMLSTIQGASTPDPATAAALQFVKQMGGTVSIQALSSEQVKGLSDTLSSATSTMNSSQEMTMISIQSLMSQRQTAVELTTNMMQTLDDTAEKIVSNVGH